MRIRLLAQTAINADIGTAKTKPPFCGRITKAAAAFPAAANANKP